MTTAVIKLFHIQSTFHNFVKKVESNYCVSAASLDLYYCIIVYYYVFPPLKRWSQTIVYYCVFVFNFI
jgi:low affinity Fe/Cu permease